MGDSVTITAYKHAQLWGQISSARQLQAVLFRPVTMLSLYGPVAEMAPCSHGVDCMSSLSGRCGFHALKSPLRVRRCAYDRATRLRDGEVLLRVGLWGTVIEGMWGYRASHQSVLSIGVSSLCESCRRQASSGLAPHFDGAVGLTPLRAVCDGCGPAFSFAQVESLTAAQVAPTRVTVRAPRILDTSDPATLLHATAIPVAGALGAAAVPFAWLLYQLFG